MDYLKKFYEFIDSNNLIKKNDKILVGFSGGKDSVFLAHLLLSAGFRIALAHLNHLLRDKESYRDMEFSQNFAKKYNIEIFTKIIDIKYIAKRKGISIEEAGRLERYKFFNELCEKHGFTKYATAHHIDDQVETFFINFFRKKGIFSLKGISLKQGRCIRPVLCFTREDIENYIKLFNLEYVEDSSNIDVKFIRNRIRHLLIPYIKENFNVDIRKIVDFYSKQIKDIDIIVKKEIENIFALNVFKEDNGFILKIKRIESELLRMELYKKILEQLNVSFSEKLLHRIDNLYNSKKTTGKIFQKKLKIFKEYSYLYFENTDFKEIFSERIIESEGEYILFNNYRLLISRCKREEIKDFNDKDTEYFDEKKVKFPLKVRFFRNGDRFQPLGFSKPVKLKKIFINNKVPLRKRKKVLIVEDSENDIIFVQGIRISEKVKIDENTENVLKIKILLN